MQDQYQTQLRLLASLASIGWPFDQRSKDNHGHIDSASGIF
jgi:hypothetical protein